MMRAAFLVAAGLLLAAPSPAWAQLDDSGPGPWIVGPAIDADLGARYVGPNPSGKGTKLFYRGGLGVFWLNREQLVSTTATVARTPASQWTFGMQGEVVRTTRGTGLSAGANWSTSRVVGLHAGPSFSVLHLEGQVFFEEKPVWAVALYLRIPVGVIGRVLFERDRSL